MTTDTFEARVTLAKQAVPFARVLTVDNDGKITRVALPGRNGHRYEVKLRYEGYHLAAKCLQDFGALGMRLCKACENGLVCYHVLTAIEVRAKNQGYSISWCSNGNDARRLGNLGGHVFRVQSSHGNRDHSVWGVWKEK